MTGLSIFATSGLSTGIFVAPESANGFLLRPLILTGGPLDGEESGEASSEPCSPAGVPSAGDSSCPMPSTVSGAVSASAGFFFKEREGPDSDWMGCGSTS